ncbi:uncharacterized membrane protein (DUF4010 family) [Luteimonas cucumeris]|uniref:Uncharacterized membrane protein (DUF4010 family) n=1 Tax=Luteimonas cucumeris TaxID=985012 RepID=A0A562KVL7_9GAMM|nr:DUF4010 domain-containing protein [Luteimonas cucumeris]TWH99469.1 uncharacterized membrane protein (DUF4010 family) [Luteimonas cucumeris]
MDADWNTLLEELLTALGIGLLIGLVRERRKDDPDAGVIVAGLRTHALVALTAAVSWQIDFFVYLLLFALVGALIVASYLRSAVADPGLTGEVAMLFTTLLGALAMRSPPLAAALGVAAAVLLHAKTAMHRFTRVLVSERELHDGLLLAACALIVLPLLPREAVDPWGVLKPAELWTLVVLVMAAGVAGHVAQRLVGARFGMPVAGFFAGFASSTAAVASFGQRAKDAPALRRHAVSAALFANLGSLLLLAGVLAAGNFTLLRASTWPLVAAALTLAGLAAFGMWHAPADEVQIKAQATQARAFKLGHALLFAATIAGLLLLTAWLRELIGDRGALVVAAIAATAELQAAAVTVGQLASAHAVTLPEARWGIVALLASSAAAKSGLAFLSGGAGYGSRVTVGLLTMTAAAAAVAWWVPFHSA